MLNRWIGIACVFLMISGNTVLFMRDILPSWLASDPPQFEDISSQDGAERQIQVGIFDADGQLVGRSWTISHIRGHFLNVDSKTMLYPIRLPGDITTPPVRIDTELSYQERGGLLSELGMRVFGLPASAELYGEFIPPDEFACTWKIERVRQGTFVLDAEATRALGEVLRPFSRLPGLYVGRAWRLHLLDPLAQIVPGLQQNAVLAEPEIVRVTRAETIEHRGRSVEVFVVEARRMRAWVATDGSVLRQEIELPLLGQLVLRDEPFDHNAYEAARGWSAKP